MALITTIGERTYSYSHCVGMLTAFSGPVDMALGGPGEIFVSCRASEPGSRPGRGQGWVRWNLETDTLIIQVRSQDTGEREIVWPSALVLTPEGRVLQADEWRNRVSTYTVDGDYLGSWGAGGPGFGQLDGPSGMRQDSQGNLVIAESRNNRVQTFTTGGAALSSFGEAGAAPGQFNMPYGLHLDAADNVYVADWGNDRVQKFTAGGELLAVFGENAPLDNGGLTRPTGVAVDAQGDVYVADCGNNRVQIYTAQGEYVTGLYGDARTLSKSAQHYVDVNPNMRKARMRADTSKEWGLFRPTSVTIAGNEMILAAEAISGRIQFYQKEKDYTDPQFNL